MAATNRTYAVLAVEDDEDHAVLIRAAFAHRDIGARVHVTARAEEAVDYLLGRGDVADRARFPLPDVIILDVNLPGLGGLGFLAWLTAVGGEAETAGAADIPVIVFTGVMDHGLAKQCFALGAREFKVKPRDFNELVDLVHRVLDRWRP